MIVIILEILVLVDRDASEITVVVIDDDAGWGTIVVLFVRFIHMVGSSLLLPVWFEVFMVFVVVFVVVFVALFIDDDRVLQPQVILKLTSFWNTIQCSCGIPPLKPCPKTVRQGNCLPLTILTILSGFDIVSDGPPPQTKQILPKVGGDRVVLVFELLEVEFSGGTIKPGGLPLIIGGPIPPPGVFVSIPPPGGPLVLPMPPGGPIPPPPNPPSPPGGPPPR